MNFFIIKEWFKYFHLQTDEHSLHSPYFYKFYTELIKPRHNGNNSAFDEIEKQRKVYLKSTEDIEMLDYGAGSKVLKTDRRKISKIAASSISQKKFSIFLNRVINHFSYKNVIELGTSLGINTAYTAHNTSSNITSFEGDPSLCTMANDHLRFYRNVKIIQGNIDDTLALHLEESTEPLDLAYIDANHTYVATLKYFELMLNHCHANSILIFDDIHWSHEMKEAWENIKRHPQVTASIDIFDAGLVFFNPDFSKQHYILNF